VNRPAVTAAAASQIARTLPCYRVAMKNKKKGQQPFTAPLLQDLVDRQKSDSLIENIGVVQKPADEQAPDLYQDAGGGYNRNFVFPQE
jgi:hypothetical protein